MTTRDPADEKPPYRSIMAEEADSHIEAAVYRVTRKTVPELLRAHEAGELDETDPDVRQALALARLWRSGR
jgi:hypothetical protein